MVLSRNRSRRHAFRLRKSKRLRAQERSGGLRAYRRLPNSLTHPDPAQRRPEPEGQAAMYGSGEAFPPPNPGTPGSPGNELNKNPVPWPGPPRALPPASSARHESHDWRSAPTHSRPVSPNPTSPTSGPASGPASGPVPSLAAQLLALFSEPGVHWLGSRSMAKALQRPIQDVRNLITSLEQAGYLESKAQQSSPAANADPFIDPLHDKLYRVHPHRKAELEQLYRQSAHALGESTALDRYPEASLDRYAEEDEPRLPITAGILSLFLPGTGQLLNGDIGRAVLVFAIWALAVIAPHPAIIIFVRLYAGAEAFFNAKLRRLAQQRAIEAAKERQQKLNAPGLAAPTPALPHPGGS